MLQLHFAPSADLLVPLLLGTLRAVWTDPLYSPTIIVPNPAMGTWLKLRLAECAGGGGQPLGLGCVANLRTPTLERFLWDALRPGEARLLDAALLRQVINALLDEELLRARSYDPVRAYLMAQRGIDPVKRAQLSSRIARQFLEYEYNRPGVWDKGARRWRRPGVADCWLAGAGYFGVGNGPQEDILAAEAWQSDLYRRAIAAIESAFAPLGNAISLPRLYRRRRNEDTMWTADLGFIALFQVSKISHFHRNLLVEISQMPGVEMAVFLTNPCAEFWEDVNTRRSALRRVWRHDSAPQQAGVAPRTPGDYDKSELRDIAPLPADHRLLELWGRAGKENIFLWCPQAEWNFEYHCPAWVESDAAPTTLLKALQLSLLRRSSDLPARTDGAAWTADGSLQVLACPDPGREVEELREQILDMVEQGVITRLNEAAVYLPDPAAYLPHIHRVFEAQAPGDPGHISFAVLGAPGSDSLFAQAAQVLLDILENRFDRAHVFALLRNPIVQCTRGIAAEDVAMWERWAEELGIYRGYNRAHRALLGDRGAAVTDAHTFELGITRLLLGNLTAEPVECAFLSIDESESTAQIPPYRDFNTSDADRVEGFCHVIEALHEDVTKIAQSAQSAGLSEAAAAFIRVVDAWLGGRIDERVGNPGAEGRIRRAFRDALGQLALRWLSRERDASVSMAEFVVLVRECLPEELPAGGRAWTGGITFAPLRPAMVVPHTAIFALGMNAAAFPGAGVRSSWDLLSFQRLVGDPDPVYDNRFAFLELLHAAQERLVISFCSRDMQKEEILQPSSVVLELEAFLMERGLVAADPARPGAKRCAIRRDIPWIVREAIASGATTGRGCGSWDAVEARLARLLDLPRARYRYEPAAAPPCALMPALRVGISDLRTFFANPLEYHLSRTLGINIDEVANTMGATNEPAESSLLALSGLQRAVLTEVLLRAFPQDPGREIRDAAALADDAAAIASRIHRLYLVNAQSPEAQMGRMERRLLMQWARDAAAAVMELRTMFTGHCLLQSADLSLGREGLTDALTVPLRNGGWCAVECRHGWALAPREWRAGGQTIALVAMKRPAHLKNAPVHPDLWLAGVVQWLAEHQAPAGARATIKLLHFDREETAFAAVSLLCPAPKTSPGALERWLGDLIAEMLLDKRSDHLPFAVIQDLMRDGPGPDGSWDQQWKAITGAGVQERLDAEYSPYTCYLESFGLVEARIPSVADEDLRAMARRRFAPLIEGWIHE